MVSWLTYRDWRAAMYPTPRDVATYVQGSPQGKPAFYRIERWTTGRADCRGANLDQIKVVNDGSGHQAGDLVLRQVASAIQSSLRNTDIASRYGGDEFAIVLPDTD